MRRAAESGSTVDGEGFIYHIIKVLDNNGMLVLGGDTGREPTLLGNGISLGHRTGERLERVKEAEWHELMTERFAVLQQVDSIGPAFIEAAGNIAEPARETPEDVSSDILIPVTDYITLAAGRAREGRELPNSFNQDIKALFDREYQAVMEGREIVREMTGTVISENEMGHITLHAHAGSSEKNMAHSMDMVRLVQDGIRSIEEKIGIKLVVDSLGYNRLMSRLRYMIARIRREEPVSLDMEAYAKDAFPGPYQVAVDVCGGMEKRLGTSVTPREVGFLAIHIQRVIQGEQERPGPTSEKAGSRSVYLPASRRHRC